VLVYRPVLTDKEMCPVTCSCQQQWKRAGAFKLVHVSHKAYHNTITDKEARGYTTAPASAVKRLSDFMECEPQLGTRRRVEIWTGP